MENPNQNLPNEPIAKPEIKPQGPGIRADSLFFNVMPRDKSQGSVIAPILKNQQGPEKAAPKFDIKGFLKKNKWYLIFAAAILIGGPAIYFLVVKVGGSPYKSENILVQLPPKNANQTAGDGQQLAGFTTDQKWRDKYFPNCSDASLCGDAADPDRDGLTNGQEFKLGTDPNNADSDQDGLADGDETAVFGTNPLNSHTANDIQYADSDYFKGGYDIGTGKKMTPPQIASVSAKMKQFGLHEPTLKTLGDIVNSLYNFSADAKNPAATTSPGSLATSSSPSNLDQSIEAKQDRDAQRSATIKNVEVALVRYQTDNKAYPDTSDFATMFANIKLYLKVATNQVDPINKDPFVYSYASQAGASDFTLTFYSEVAGQLIKKHAADAIKDANSEQAAVYDNQRQTDLESLRTALLLYSQNNIAGAQTYVFPSVDKYKTAVVPDYISQIPKDPKTGADYQYQVSSTFDTFTLKALLDNPAPGTSGWLCNQEECRNY